MNTHQHTCKAQRLFSDRLSAIPTQQINFLILLIILFAAIKLPTAHAATVLSDLPIYSSVSVPGNVALALSVEYPTALGSAYTDNYSTSNTYLGYFDDKKCYQYDPAIPLYNTGVDDNGNLLADGTTDTHWSITSAPNGYGNGVMNVASGSLYVGYGAGISTTAKALGTTPPANTSYTYRTSFFIPANINASSVVITFSLGHDDNLTSLKVNGASTGYSSGAFSFGDSITLNSSNSTFISGAINTIDITIYNVAGQAAIEVDNIQVSLAGIVAPNTDGSYFVQFQRLLIIHAVVYGAVIFSIGR